LNPEDKSSNNVIEDIFVGEEANNNAQTTESSIEEVEKSRAKIGENSTNKSESNQIYYIQPLSENKTKINGSLRN